MGWNAAARYPEPKTINDDMFRRHVLPALGDPPKERHDQIRSFLKQLQDGSAGVIRRAKKASLRPENEPLKTLDRLSERLKDLDGLLEDADLYARIDLSRQLAPFLRPFLTIEAINRLVPDSGLPTRPGMRARETRTWESGDITAWQEPYLTGYLDDAALAVVRAILIRLREAADNLRCREREKGTAGRGRPPDELRRMVLSDLCYLYEEMTGRRPGGSGPFLSLCTAVFDGFGWPTAGLDGAVRALAKERKKLP